MATQKGNMMCGVNPSFVLAILCVCVCIEAVQPSGLRCLKQNSKFNHIEYCVFTNVE